MLLADQKEHLCNFQVKGETKTIDMKVNRRGDYYTQNRWDSIEITKEKKQSMPQGI